MKKTIFGKEVDLVEYESRWTKQEIENKIDGKFIKFIWIDLSKKDPNSNELANAGVRSEQNSSGSISDMQFSFSKRNWDISEFPPVVDTDEGVYDGRTRIIAAMAEGERFLPAAMIVPSEKSKICAFTNGLRLNFHPPRKAAVQEDFIVAGVELIRSKELDRDMLSIEEWLLKKVKIDDYYPNNAGGSISKIISAIYNRTEKGGDPIVRKLDREKWLDWLESSPDMVDVSGRKIDSRINLDTDSDFLLYDAPSSTNETRLLGKILENGCRGRHTYFALYSTNEKDVEYLRAGYKNFLTNVQTYHSSIIKYTNYSVNFPGIDLTKMETPKLYTCLGVLPQLFDGEGHEKAFKAHRIISIDRF